MSKQVILVMAGGTGGHIFPALATARKLAAEYDIHWVGTLAGMERHFVPAEWPLHSLPSYRLRRQGWRTYVKAPWLMLRALWHALRLMQRVRPTLVVGFGGFVAGPGGLAARLLGYKLVIHEQNAVIGLTNKVLATIAHRVLQGFPITPGIYTGNPLRENFLSQPEPAERFAQREGPVRLLILGGSLGALALNRLLPEALHQLKLPLIIRHQCGQEHLQVTQQAYVDQGLDVTVMPFIADMAAAYSWADFVIARAGAMTIAELMAVGVGSLLIPFPFAAGDHQTYNAAYLATAGAAYVHPQQTLTAAKIVQLLRPLLTSRQTLLTMASIAKQLTPLNATQNVVTQCLKIIQGSHSL